MAADHLGLSCFARHERPQCVERCQSDQRGAKNTQADEDEILGVVPRIRKTATVAHTSAPSVKNCHGRSESDVGCVGDKGLVEVFELPVEPCLQSRVSGRSGARSASTGSCSSPDRCDHFLMANTPPMAPNPAIA